MVFVLGLVVFCFLSTKRPFNLLLIIMLSKCAYNIIRALLKEMHCAEGLFSTVYLLPCKRDIAQKVLTSKIKTACFFSFSMIFLYFVMVSQRATVP